MFRDEKEIYINTKCYGGMNDKSFTRRKKKKILIEEYEEKIYHLKFQIKHFKHSINRENLTKEDVNRYGNLIKEKEQELTKCYKKLEELRSIKEFTHKPLKRKLKKRSNEWIEKEVLKIIAEAIKNKHNFITKEDVSIKLQVKESQVEQVFVKLNKEGILSQAEHRALHDSNRDPWGYDDYHGWAADTYTILKKEP